MRLLLDTHTFMRWDSAADNISKETFELIGQSKNEIFVKGSQFMCVCSTLEKLTAELTDK